MQDQAQSLEYARMNSFDIIFMDLHMPGLDGYETTKKIRDITPGEQPVIIALTANALPQEKEKAIHSGMNGILIKPVSATMLQKVINQWVLKGETAPSTLNSSTTNDLVNDSNDNNSATFSIELAKKFTSGNEELAYELFNMLRNELHNYQQRISTAVENTDLNSLREQVHKLNGASRCCGTENLQKISSHIENLINQHIDFDIEKETKLLLIEIKNVADYKIKNNS